MSFFPFSPPNFFHFLKKYSPLPLESRRLIATTLLFALNQFPSLRDLGRWPCIVSITSVVVVIVICLVATKPVVKIAANSDSVKRSSPSGYELAMRYGTALSGIVFASASQKLLLNIRAEMVHPSQANTALCVALGIYGLAYILVTILAGSNPPSFLLDAVQQTNLKSAAGALLWVHVAVSYAINSQALCSCLAHDDRAALPHTRANSLFTLMKRRHKRLYWTLLTSSVTVAAWIVANAVPFFADLVGLIGALTQAPLSLLLPIIFYLRAVPRHGPVHRLCCAVGIVCATILLVYGTIGALSTITADWSTFGRPFGCGVVGGGSSVRDAPTRERAQQRLHRKFQEIVYKS